MRKVAYLLVVGVALALFNPNLEDFESYVEERSSEFFGERLGDSSVSEMLSDLGGDVTRALARHVTERDNYYLFSIYSIDLDGAESSENEWRFLGIAGRFFEIDRPESTEN